MVFVVVCSDYTQLHKVFWICCTAEWFYTSVENSDSPGFCVDDWTCNLRQCPVLQTVNSLSSYIETTMDGYMGGYMKGGKGILWVQAMIRTVRLDVYIVSLLTSHLYRRRVKSRRESEDDTFMSPLVRKIGNESERVPSIVHTRNTVKEEGWQENSGCRDECPLTITTVVWHPIWCQTSPSSDILSTDFSSNRMEGVKSAILPSLQPTVLLT